MGMLAHLAGRVLKTLFSVVFYTIVFAALGAAAVLAVAYASVHQWPPQPLTIVAAVAFGVLAGYASAVTVILRALVGAGEAVEHEVTSVAEKELSGTKS